eukprot:11214002-Lingulodinium_polyedra.AAC.1
MCARIPRLLLNWARKTARAVAMLFIDVVGAFDAVIRALMFADLSCDVDIAKVLHDFGFGPEVFHEIVSTIAKGTTLQKAGVHPHLQWCLAESHADSWFTTQGVVDPVATFTGVKVGDPLGDMLYNMLEARVLHEIESTARSHGLSCGLPSVEAPLAEAVGL